MTGDPTNNGSSPRVWGGLSRPIRVAGRAPAHPHACGADPLPQCSGAARWRVHPHACGADGRRRAWRTYGRRFIPTRVGRTYQRPEGPPIQAGSSPRVWGGRPDTTAKHRSGSVHPHACGADSGRALRYSYRNGSSPRVWGGPPPGPHWPRQPPVHPHACGADCRADGNDRDRERFIPTRVGRSVVGLRGTSGVPRFIPTRVGRTIMKGNARAFFTVHPHACGADT